MPWYQSRVAVWAESLGVEHKPAKMKSAARVIEKTGRSYKDDVSRVLDFVRSTLVTRSVAETRRVLEFVMNNATVRTAKNRYDPGYNGVSTAGYRDVNIQLQFDEFNGALFEGFVFELQIILAEFFALKSGDGHKRYVTCRNLRGD